MIDFFNINHERHEATKVLVESEIGIDNILISAVTKMELLIGARDKQQLAKINKQIHRFSIILINDEITKTAIDLLQKYRLSHGLAIPDALIASTALNTQFDLLTYNLKDYQFISGINLYLSK